MGPARSNTMMDQLQAAGVFMDSSGTLVQIEEGVDSFNDEGLGSPTLLEPVPFSISTAPAMTSRISPQPFVNSAGSQNMNLSWETSLHPFSSYRVPYGTQNDTRIQMVGNQCVHEKTETIATYNGQTTEETGADGGALKQELKSRIQTKLRQKGLDGFMPEVLFEDRQTTQQLSSEEEERRKRRRECNRIAAQKCRLKKRQQAQVLLKEQQELESSNTELRYQIRELNEEKERLMDLVTSHLRVCSTPQILSKRS